MPGLGAEVGLLAWKHRSESPVIFVSTPTFDDVEGSSPSTGVCVMPRTVWNDDPASVDLFNENVREKIRQDIDAADFFPDEHYYVIINDESWSGEIFFASLFFEKSSQGALRSIEILESLTSSATATREDLVVAIAWMRERMSAVATVAAKRDIITAVIDHFDDQADMYGPSRALCNQIAFLMFRCLLLQFRVTLVGLSGANAVHLNGQTGVIRDQATADLSRFVVRLDEGGREVSVKAGNMEHIRGENYRRLYASGE